MKVGSGHRILKGGPPATHRCSLTKPSSELRRPFLIIFCAKCRRDLDLVRNIFLRVFPRGILEIQLDFDKSIDFLAVLEPLDGEVGGD